jgi:basic membrane protein A
MWKDGNMSKVSVLGPELLVWDIGHFIRHSAVATARIQSTIRFIALALAATMFISGGGTIAAAQAQQVVLDKVAVVLPGPISDKGFNFAGFDGLRNAAQSRGLQFAYAENVSVADAAAALRDFAEKGYNPIFAHGFQFGDAATVVATSYPDTYFAVINGGVQNGKNLASFQTAIQEGGFLAGVLAAGWSKTKKVGAIGGIKIPPIQNAMAGFAEGVKWMDPSIMVSSVWTASFSDVARAREMAKLLIAQGVDVLYMEANESNLGIISACEEAKTFAIGYAMDQSNVGPHSVLTSTMINFASMYGLVIDAVKSNRFDGTSKQMGLAEKVVHLAPFHSFDESIPASLRGKLDDATKLLAEKKIDALPAK